VEREPAAELPVARVAVDVPLPHLDRPFDYLVPATLTDAAVPGTRVRVRFAGQLVDGFVLGRADRSEHPGRLAYLERVVSPEQVLTAEVARLARTVADRYAGTLADVLRLAVPARHGKAEGSVAAVPGEPVAAPDDKAWSEFRAGAAFLRALRDGKAPRAVVTMPPGESWPDRLAEAAAATLAGGRGAVIVVPDAGDLDRLETAVERVAPGRCVALSAALGPAERYRRFLRASRAAGDRPGHHCVAGRGHPAGNGGLAGGDLRAGNGGLADGDFPAGDDSRQGRDGPGGGAGVPLVVIGTRAAMFAPVARLGLVVVWDDGDDLHAEPRAPYPHTREVLLTRAQLAGAGALVAGFGRTSEGQLLLATGWAREIVPDRTTVRARSPRVVPVGDEAQLARDPAAASVRLPSVAWRAARDALAADAPVLVQVPRRGYLPSVTCAECRQPARCAVCSGPLALGGATAAPVCRWCGHIAGDYACPRCGHRRVRAAVIGAGRTAEELGRAFPGVPVRTSGGDAVLASVPYGAQVVVATPGAEPSAPGGYGAALLLDTWALLTRTDLRAGEEALRRWLAAACLVRPATGGGQVVVVADGGLPPVQALLRFDPGWYADRELAERRALGFPPAVRMASLTGRPDAIAELLDLADLPEGADILGPVPLESQPDTERALVRVRRAAGPALAAALHAAAGVRSAKKAADPVRIQIDPLDPI
jgi:primosomal protein N' (replication factor Y)